MSETARNYVYVVKVKDGAEETAPVLSAQRLEEYKREAAKYRVDRRDVASEMEILSTRADARRVSRPAAKSDADAKVENENFSALKSHVYMVEVKAGQEKPEPSISEETLAEYRRNVEKYLRN